MLLTSSNQGKRGAFAALPCAPRRCASRPAQRGHIEYTVLVTGHGTLPFHTCFSTFEASKHVLGLGFPLVTDVRDPSTGLPMRQPSDGVPSRQPGGALPTRQSMTGLPSGFGGDPRARGPELPDRGPSLPARGPGVPARGPEMPPRGGDMPARGPVVPSRGPADVPPRGMDRGGGEAFPVRQPTFRPPRRTEGGRHRRAVPAMLPQSALALLLAVPGQDTDLSVGPAAELAAVLRVDNPAVDVRAARIDGGGFDDPSDLRAVLADATARRPDGGPCAVVIPLIATVHPPVTRRLREVVAASGTNAIVSGFINSNAMIAEALHIRLAEAGLARADRVRLFSIVTAADGILIVTVGGPDGAMAANVTSVLLAARLALPVITASLDSSPSIQEGAMRLKEMGVNRLAIAPCIIGPEASRSDLDAMAIGAECAAPLGAHGNIAKLAAMAYGQAISQLEIPGEPLLT